MTYPLYADKSFYLSRPKRHFDWFLKLLRAMRLCNDIHNTSTHCTFAVGKKKVSLAFLYFPWKSSIKSIWYGNKWVEFSLKISRSKEHSLKIPSCSQSDKKKKNALKLKSSLRKKSLSKSHTKCRSTTYAELFIAVNGSNIIHTACPSSVKKDIMSIPEACISMN